MKVTFIYPDIEGGSLLPEASTTYRPETKKLGGFNEGIAQLIAILKDKGHKTKLLHYTEPPKPASLLQSISGSDLIAFSSNSFTYPYVQKWSQIIKQKSDTPMILGGVHPTLAPEQSLMQSHVNAINIGEGDYSLPKFCEAIEKGELSSPIPNIWWKQDGKIIKERSMYPLANLDQLPFPDRSLWDYTKLFSSLNNTLRIMVSRGCPYSCKYCSNHQLRSASMQASGKWVRYMSPRHAINYIQYAISEFNLVDNINFNDTILPLSKQWTDRFLLLYKREVDLPFVCRTRPDLIRPKLCQQLKNAGCTKVIFGVESGSPRIRKIIGRTMKTITIIKAFRECQRNGLKTKALVMLGLPSETESDIKATIRLLRKLNPDEIVGTIFHPFAHTKLYDYCIQKGYIHTNFKITDKNLFQSSPLRMPQISPQTIKYYQENLLALVDGGIK